MLLYRPVGLEELRLIYAAEMRAFPPRLPDQPIFYPVTNDGYAKQIARDWNTKSGTRAGFVTRFSVDDAYAEKFERRVVGAREHEELWVPAEELDAFNRHIEGAIEVIAAYFGDAYEGDIPEAFGLRGKDARAQLAALAAALSDSGMDFVCETGANHAAVFLNYFFWEQHDFTDEGLGVARRDAVLRALTKAWGERSASAPLGSQ